MESKVSSSFPLRPKKRGVVLLHCDPQVGPENSHQLAARSSGVIKTGMERGLESGYRTGTWSQGWNVVTGLNENHQDRTAVRSNGAGSRGGGVECD